MNIIKRNGKAEAYDKKKIENAIRKAFLSTKETISEEEIANMALCVEARIIKDSTFDVEHIQDRVEETLMEHGHYKEAKAYILFRNNRTKLREERNAIIKLTNDEDIAKVLEKIQIDFPDSKYSLSILFVKFDSFIKEGMDEKERLDAFFLSAISSGAIAMLPSKVRRKCFWESHYILP